MRERCSADWHRMGKVVAVFVGGHAAAPSRGQCCAALSMDPDIEPPVEVIAFQLPAAVDDINDFAVTVIKEQAPGFLDGPFFITSTLVGGFLLIKVLTDWRSDEYGDLAPAGGSVISRFGLN